MARKGLTGAQVAKKLKISPAMLSRIINGERQPGKNLDAWANAFGLSEAQEISTFIELGHLARLPPTFGSHLAGVLEGLREEIKELRKQLEAIQSEQSKVNS